MLGALATAHLDRDAPVRQNACGYAPFQIQEALDRLMEGRTTFVMAHRLSTIVHADCIVVLKKGRIAESGDHWQLMQQDGYYT